MASFSSDSIHDQVHLSLKFISFKTTSHQVLEISWRPWHVAVIGRWSTKQASAMTSSEVHGFSSQCRRQSIDLLLRQILQHLSPERGVLNCRDYGSNIHSLRLSLWWSIRLWPSSVGCPKGLILNKFSSHFRWDVGDEVWVKAHRDRLFNFRINFFLGLYWLLLLLPSWLCLRRSLYLCLSEWLLLIMKCTCFWDLSSIFLPFL